MLYFSVCSVAKLNIIIDSHLHDGGVFIEGRLDLAAANVLAAADDDVFLSVHDVTERGEKDAGREGDGSRGKGGIVSRRHNM
jgi:hypothetical protein